MKKLNFDGQSIAGGFKISKAQKATLEIVGATAVVVGAGLVLIIDFFKFIDFNNKVLEKQDDAISAYSVSIKNSGACKSPKEKDYTQKELNECRPNEVESKDVAGSLRARVMDDASSNLALESVARASLAVCFDSDSGKAYSAADLDKKIMEAETSNDKRFYTNVRKLCTSLRVIPDSLPIVKNTEALLASLNNIYITSNWDSAGLAPISSNSSSSTIEGLYSIPLSITKDDTDTTSVNVLLKNLGRSIRYFNILNLRIDVKEGDNMGISASAEAYYTSEVSSSETTETINANGGKQK